MQLDDDGRLALAQTLYKMTGELVDTKNPDSLRAREDAKYKELYEQTGARSFDVRIGDEIVGTYSIRFSKPKDSESHKVLEVEDYYDLAAFVTELDADLFRKYAETELAAFADWYLFETGEVPDGCKLVEVVTPAVGKEYIGGALKVNTQAVIDAMRGQLSQGIAGLLEAANE